MKTGSRILFVICLLLMAQGIYSQTFGEGYYRLTTQWLGNGKSLDVVNDGTNNQLQIAKTAKVSGQAWKITPIGDTGYFRLTTEWMGSGKSLDVVNDGKNNKLQLAATDDVTGQYWKITSLGDGFIA
ncbi:MAG: RICIN domain-containing protein [Acidobacteria bacterium]|nr:RICIN domain-containing protein [Acidobacteriota bacterium]